MRQAMKRAGAACPAPTASPCCAIPTATASPTSVRCSSPGSILRSGWRWWATTSTWRHGCAAALSLSRTGDLSISRPRHAHARAARGTDQPPLDEERPRQPRRLAALRDRRLEQQRGENAAWRTKSHRASIWEVELSSGTIRVFARDCAIRTGWPGDRDRTSLWTVVNERDELGNDLVPDYHDGGRRGWLLRLALQLFRSRTSTRVQPQRPDLVARAIAPDYALGSHTASLGLAFSAANALPAALSRRHVRRTARIVESQAAERLQGHLRAIRRRQAGGASGSTC